MYCPEKKSKFLITSKLFFFCRKRFASVIFCSNPLPFQLTVETHPFSSLKREAAAAAAKACLPDQKIKFALPFFSFSFSWGKRRVVEGPARKRYNSDTRFVSGGTEGGGSALLQGEKFTEDEDIFRQFKLFALHFSQKFLYETYIVDSCMLVNSTSPFLPFLPTDRPTDLERERTKQREEFSSLFLPPSPIPSPNPAPPSSPCSQFLSLLFSLSRSHAPTSFPEDSKK